GIVWLTAIVFSSTVVAPAITLPPHCGHWNSTAPGANSMQSGFFMGGHFKKARKQRIRKHALQQVVYNAFQHLIGNIEASMFGRHHLADRRRYRASKHGLEGFSAIHKLKCLSSGPGTHCPSPCTPAHSRPSTRGQ